MCGVIHISARNLKKARIDRTLRLFFNSQPTNNSKNVPSAVCQLFCSCISHSCYKLHKILNVKTTVFVKNWVSWTVSRNQSIAREKVKMSFSVRPSWGHCNEMAININCTWSLFGTVSWITQRGTESTVAEQNETVKFPNNMINLNCSGSAYLDGATSKPKHHVSSTAACTDSPWSRQLAVGLLFKGWVIKKQTRSDLWLWVLTNAMGILLAEVEGLAGLGGEFIMFCFSHKFNLVLLALWQNKLKHRSIWQSLNNLQLIAPQSLKWQRDFIDKTCTSWTAGRIRSSVIHPLIEAVRIKQGHCFVYSCTQMPQLFSLKSWH